MAKVLVCDDDKEIVEAIDIYLTQEGYEVFKAYDGQEALEVLKKESVDLLVIDVMMPRLDGIRATLKIREENNIPIIILSAKSEDADKILGLNVGADDYVTKPFNPLELVARVKSQLRRYTQLGSTAQPAGEKIYATGGLMINDDLKEVTVDGEPVKFRSGKAKELMALCVYRDGRPVSIHEIVENLWGENADGTGYRRTIKELADTLRDYGAEEMFLRSRGSLRVRMDLADSDFQAFMSGDEDAICQFQGVFMQQYSWAEPMVCTLQEKKELMLARMGKHRM